LKLAPLKYQIIFVLTAYPMMGQSAKIVLGKKYNQKIERDAAQ
jgi:hypothetical protein